MISEEFFRWAENANAEQRAAASAALTRTYLYADITKAEREEAENVLTVMAEDSSALVRQVISETFAIAKKAPRHILKTLVNDCDTVAEPLVRQSPDLTERDLIELVSERSQTIHAAIAARFTVTRAVCAALCETAGDVACQKLIENESADIPIFSLSRLVERFGKKANIREALMARHGLPLSIRQRLIEQLSHELGSFLNEKQWMSKERMERVLSEAYTNATLNLAFEYDVEKLFEYVGYLRETEQLTPALVLHAACLGNIPFLAVVLSDLSGYNGAKVSNIIENAMESPFRAVYRRSGMPDNLYKILWTAIRVWHETDFDGDELAQYQFAQKMIERIMTSDHDMLDEESQELVAFLDKISLEARRAQARQKIYASSSSQEKSQAKPQLIDIKAMRVA